MLPLPLLLYLLLSLENFVTTFYYNSSGWWWCYWWCCIYFQCSLVQFCFCIFIICIASLPKHPRQHLFFPSMFWAQSSLFLRTANFFRLSCCILHGNFQTEGQLEWAGGWQQCCLAGGGGQDRGAADRTGTGQLGRKVSMKAKFIVAAQSKCNTKKEEGRYSLHSDFVRKFISVLFCVWESCHRPAGMGQGKGHATAVKGREFMFMMCVPERCLWYASLR